MTFVFALWLVASAAVARVDPTCEAALRPQHRRVYLYVKAPLTYVGGVPHVTVYRGLRDAWRAEYESPAYGQWMYTSLDPEVALDYMVRGSNFRAAERVALLRLRLPLKLAHVAKRKAYEDSYRLVEEQRLLDWLFWGARVRRRERELVWNLIELGDLTRPEYGLSVIEREMPRVDGLDWVTGFDNVRKAQASIREAMASGDWCELGRGASGAQCASSAN